MSTFKHPVGPQPSRVYWRRRLLVGLGLIAVIVVIILILVRPGASDGAPVPAPSASPTASTSPSASASSPTSSPSASGTPAAASKSSPAAAVAAAPQPCDKGVVQVKPATDALSYAPGVLPKLSVSITNTGTTSCTIDAGTAQQVFTITSGSDTYWKSSDCQADKADAQVLLQPGKTISSQTPLQWDRTRSDPTTCQQARPQVPAGGASYHLAVTVAGIASATTQQFSLR
ncbi:MAG TPA: hypothetical protein VIG28_00940 [Leifsonia sp.]